MMKKYILALCSLSLLLLWMVPVHAQETIRVQGTVIGEEGNPISGVSVEAVGTKMATVTDREGKFAIYVPAKGRLHISYLGYEPQTITNLSDPIIILKESVSEMDQIVVMGYGTNLTGRKVTGAVSVVRPEEIRDLATGDLASSLRGMVPGLEVIRQGNRPGDVSTLVIRNADMLNLDKNFKTIDAIETITTPLYVIDDYISTEEVFNNLNINEIENITILKDAAASVYGVNGARGVVLVTTKRGERGLARISYQGQFGFSDALKHPKMLDAQTYGRLWNAVVRAADRSSSEEINYPEMLFTASELDAMKNLDFNLLDKYWKAASTQRHSITLSGGNENGTYFTNVSYYTQAGNIGRLDYDRWNFRSGLDSRIGKWIKVSTTISGSYGQQESAYSTMASGSAGSVNSETDYRILLMNPRHIPDYVNGLPIVRNGVENLSDVNSLQNYHFDTIQKSENYRRTSPLDLNINLSFTHDLGWTGFLKGLTTKVSYSRNLSSTKVNTSIGDFTVYRMIDRGDGAGGSSPIGHLYTGEGLNLNMNNFEEMKLSTGGGAAGGDRGFISRTINRSDNYQLNWTTNYSRQFGLHSVSGMFSIEKAENETENLEGKRNQPYSFSNGQYITAYGSSTVGWGRSEGGRLAYIGRAGYSYDGKYLFDFVLRADASTKFAPENYWGLFPSVSVGWVMSDERFMENNKIFDFLKFRASFGLSGQDNIAAWSWMDSYGISTGGGPAFGTNPGNATMPNIKINYPPGTGGPAPNPSAHWDKSYKTNFGIDAAFLDNRLTIGLDFFYNMNREKFMFYSGTGLYASTVGAAAGAENFGSMDNYGAELSLGWRGNIGTDFRYRVGVNTAYGDNKVLIAPWPAGGIYEIGQTRPNERMSSSSWGYECLGMFRSYQEIGEYFTKYDINTYMGLKQVDVHPGMLIYRDIRGARASVASIRENPELYDEWGYEKEPDGIVNEFDMVKISNRGNYCNFSINFGGTYRNNFTFSGQIGVSWGGYSYVPDNARGTHNLVTGKTDYKQMQTVNMPVFWKDMFVYDDVYDANGNLTTPQNRDAKYPNLRYTAVNKVTSTFWKVNGFSAELRNFTVAYNLPQALIDRVGINGCRLNLTVENVLSFNNPYPKNFIDPMSGYGVYPMMRKFTLGVNVSF